MADNSLDPYFHECTMRSKITTSRNNVMINGQDGESTCQKPIWLPLPIRKCLQMFDVNPAHLQKANQRQHQSRALLQVRRHHHRRQRIKQKLHLRQNKLQRLHHGGVEQTTGKVAGPIHTVAAIGTIQDTTEEETGDKFNRPLHRS